jgi:hypothetical protein
VTRDQRAIQQMAEQAGVSPEKIRDRPATWLEQHMAVGFAVTDVLAALRKSPLGMLPDRVLAWLARRMGLGE